jgi:hypothetical protein
MPRPYIQANIERLEVLFKQHADDVALLTALLNELEHRKTPRAISLKDRILKRLAAKRTGSATSKFSPRSSRPEAAGQPTLPFDKTRSLDDGKSPSGSSVNGNGVAHDAGDAYTVPKRKISRIREPGRLTDVPDPRPGFTSNKIDLNLATGAPLIQRYIKALEFLVVDMRCKNSGMRMITVTSGRRINVDVGGYGYQASKSGFALFASITPR